MASTLQERWGVKLGLVWRARRERKPGQSSGSEVKRKRVLKPRGIAKAGDDGAVEAQAGEHAGGWPAQVKRW